MSRSDHTPVSMGYPETSGVFSDKSIRSKFVSKVYTIVAIQLLFTTVLIAWFCLHEPTKAFMRGPFGLGIMISSMVLGFVTVLLLVCVQSARRNFPINFVLLTLLTLSYGLMAAIISSSYDLLTVLYAFGATALATVVIMLIAKYSSLDITTCGAALCILGLVHLVVGAVLGLVLGLMGMFKLATLLIAISGSMLASLYIMFDLQLIMGGRSVELSPEEYILGALMLYIDIIQLFLHLLAIFGSRN